ncbi:MAG: hypothetical protein ACXWIH_02210 [Burkholderiales bacterium]
MTQCNRATVPAANAGVCAVMVHPETGQKHVGADPRRGGYAGAR